MRFHKLLVASVAVVLAVSGCRHHYAKKDGCCDPTPPPYGIRGPATLPPPNVPTQPLPGPAVPSPGPSGYLQGPVDPLRAAPSGPTTLYPDPVPGSGMSRPAPPSASGTSDRPVNGVTAEPVNGVTAEPVKASAVGTGLPGSTKVKDGLYAGRRPTIDGYDALKAARFRTVIYLHGAGADVAAVKDLAATRDLNFVAIETTPETLAEASRQFDRVAGDRVTRPAYVFADDDVRAGAVWYLHFRTADAADPDVARLRAKALGLTERGDEGKAFAAAVEKALDR